MTSRLPDRMPALSSAAVPSADNVDSLGLRASRLSAALTEGRSVGRHSRLNLSLCRQRVRMSRKNDNNITAMASSDSVTITIRPNMK